MATAKKTKEQLQAELAALEAPVPETEAEETTDTAEDDQNQAKKSEFEEVTGLWITKSAKGKYLSGVDRKTRDKWFVFPVTSKNKTANSPDYALKVLRAEADNQDDDAEFNF